LPWRVGSQTHKRGRLVDSERQKLNERISYFLREAGLGILKRFQRQQPFPKGQRKRCEEVNDRVVSLEPSRFVGVFDQKLIFRGYHGR
jgi:hypothetical protein